MHRLGAYWPHANRRYGIVGVFRTSRFFEERSRQVDYHINEKNTRALVFFGNDNNHGVGCAGLLPNMASYSRLARTAVPNTTP